MPSFMMGLDEETFHAALFLLTFFFLNQRIPLIWTKLKSDIEKCVSKEHFLRQQLSFLFSHVRHIPECRICCFTVFKFSLKHLIMMTTDTTKTSSNHLPNQIAAY